MLPSSDFASPMTMPAGPRSSRVEDGSGLLPLALGGNGSTSLASLGKPPSRARSGSASGGVPPALTIPIPTTSMSSLPDVGSVTPVAAGKVRPRFA